MSETTKQNLLKWVAGAAVRSIKTGAQTALAVIPTSAATIGDVDPMMVVGAALLGMLFSLLTSLAGIPEVEDGASVTKIARNGE